MATLNSSGLVKVSWLGRGWLALPGAGFGSSGQDASVWSQGQSRIRLSNGQAAALGQFESPGWERGVCPATYRRVSRVRQKSGWGEAGVWVEGRAKAEKRELSEA